MKLFLVLFFSTFTLFGQNIKGIVLDTLSNKPLENVHVYLNNSTNGTITNKKGAFNLKSEIEKSDTLHFSIIGYSTKKLTFSELQSLNNIISLYKKVESLKEVHITANKELQDKLRYKKLASLNVGVHSFASTLIDSKIYVIGGNASKETNAAKKTLDEMGNNPEAKVEDIIKGLQKYSSWDVYKGDLKIYDILNDTWLKSDLKFRKRTNSTISYSNNRLYVLGGKRQSVNGKYDYLDDKIEIYDLQDKTITVDDTNPHQAVNFESFVYNNNIIVMGGSIKIDKKGKKTFTNKSHIYNLETGYWYELKNMLSAKETKGVLINNKIYLVGGFNNEPLSDIESYNISTGQWTKEGDLIYGIKKPALAYNDNLIYIFDNGKLLTYNIITKTLNEYHIGLELINSELYYYNEKLYLLGGYIKSEFSKTPSSKLYSIDLNEFENTRIMNSKSL